MVLHLTFEEESHEIIKKTVKCRFGGVAFVHRFVNFRNFDFLPAIFILGKFELLSSDPPTPIYDFFMIYDFSKMF